MIFQKYLGHTKVPTLPSIVELSTAESPIIPVNLSSKLLIHYHQWALIFEI